MVSSQVMWLKSVVSSMVSLPFLDSDLLMQNQVIYDIPFVGQRGEYYFRFVEIILFHSFGFRGCSEVNGNCLFQLHRSLNHRLVLCTKRIEWSLTSRIHGSISIAHVANFRVRQFKKHSQNILDSFSPRVVRSGWQIPGRSHGGHHQHQGHRQDNGLCLGLHPV